MALPVRTARARCAGRATARDHERGPDAAQRPRQPMLNPPFNIGQPIAGMRATRVFAQPEVMVPLTSDIRPWMAAFVGVVAHPFFAVSQSNGTFVINGLPPGRYTIEAWHETLGTVTERITISSGQTTTTSFAFAAR